MSPSILGTRRDAEKAHQLRSRIVQTFNVPQRVRLRLSLAATLLDELFEHPVRVVLFFKAYTIEVLLRHNGLSSAY